MELNVKISLGRIVRNGVEEQGAAELERSAVVNELYAGLRSPVLYITPILNPCTVAEIVS